MHCRTDWESAVQGKSDRKNRDKEGPETYQAKQRVEDSDEDPVFRTKMHPRDQEREQGRRRAASVPEHLYRQEETEGPDGDDEEGHKRTNTIISPENGSDHEANENDDGLVLKGKTSETKSEFIPNDMPSYFSVLTLPLPDKTRPTLT